MDEQSYNIAELRNQPDALNAIRKLEEQLTAQSGKPIALVAYSADWQEDEHSN
ncbi:hypothetical protein M6D81_16710 [Paenibacillus sp. J5C_2022]|uniref:hypothetical protein n=1 Tax=Paenibacillus sp. J5C2022 TaxID=2977129 RepID=UPI0021D13B27|nr:hypothetical protein [Paenibacillus sp. J5C2022]MCU6710343.1 hypothetical protein [Paenibacillus sp. J5C2022]